jgi:hypothetical protein
MFKVAHKKFSRQAENNARQNNAVRYGMRKGQYLSSLCKDKAKSGTWKKALSILLVRTLAIIRPSRPQKSENPGHSPIALKGQINISFFPA